MTRSNQRPHASRALVCAALAAASAAVLGACAEVDDRPATWSYVYSTVIRPSCTSSNCHSELSATAGLMLHTREAAYVYLTGRVCEPLVPDVQPDHNFVVPYDPERSKLMYLIRGEEVRSMPPDVPLPGAEIELIERWILEGAQCN